MLQKVKESLIKRNTHDPRPQIQNISTFQNHIFQGDSDDTEIDLSFCHTPSD